MTHPVIRAHRRRLLENWIEQAIALLDQLDGDSDIEDGSDIEHDDAEQRDAEGNEGKEAVHAIATVTRVRARRSAFKVTSSEEPAMPSAAIHGETWPVAASGNATAL